MEDTIGKFLHPDTFEPLKEPKKRRWLKVIDDFNLTKLKKYGFRECNGEWIYDFGCCEELWLGENRILHYEEVIDYLTFDEIACLLFDMCKDGILEIKESN